MKKFNELKALAEKQAGRFDLFVGVSPENFLALLADRERLKLALDIYVSTMKYIVNQDDVLHFAHRMQNTFEDALKKSDGVENEC